MRKSATGLVVLAAVCFGLGTLRCFPGFPTPLPHFSPETFWRGATGLLLFAIALLMLERPKAP